MKNLFTLTFWVSIIASLSSLAQTPDIDVKFNMISIPNNTSASTTYGTSFGLVALSNGMPNNEFTIENRGTGTLTISSIDIIGTAASDFTVSNSPSTTLAPNATTTLRITFNPSVADRRSATVTITSNDPDENPFRINLFGTGMQPEMDVFGNGNPIANGSSTPITNNHTHFGAEFVTGGSIVRTFTIENNDLASLNLTGTPTKVAITGTHASDFTLTAAPSSSVARSQSTTFQITFNPSGNGVRTALLTIANDDEDENPYTFAIEGIGTTPSSSADYTISTANNTVTITDVSGNGETMEVSESNSNVRFFVSGRTYRIDGGAVTPFTTPADIPISSNTGIVVNTNAGNDIITVGAFTSSLPSLTINGGVGDDIVNMNGNITFVANANLDLDLQNDDTSPGRDVVNIGTNANVILAGTGSATIKVSQNVFVNTGGGLTTANGNLLVEANQQGTPTSGNFVGVRLNGLNALFQVTGSGLLTVKGKGGDTGNGTSGIFFYSGAKILGGTNTVTLEGTGGSTSGNISAGVYAFENSEVRSTGGNIVINGIGDGIASTNTLCHGIFVRGVIAAGGLGNVTLTGRGSLNYTEAGASGVYISSGTVTTAGGNITFNGYGGGLGNSTRCLGVFLIHSSVSPGGMGTLTIYGEGGPGTGTDNYGVGIGCAITSSGGNIIVTGKEGGGNFSQGVIVDNTDINASNGEIRTATNGGDITVTANSFVSALDNQALITGHPSNKITFLPLTNGTEINFVSTREVASSPILISDFEFDNITGGAFYFGDANTGAINVNEAITHAAGNVYFTTGQALNLNQSFGAGTGNIAINAAGGINPKSTTVDLSGNTISFASGNNLTIAIGGTTVNTGYDQLNIQGTIDLRGLNLVLSGSYVPVAGNTFTIVNNDGTDAIIGTFNGLAQGATIPNFRGSGLNATISYTGGTDNNDVVITVAAPAVSNINIKGNGFTIDNGDTSPRTEDGTDFGNIDISLTEPVVRTFTIENTGTADLIIPANGITKSGAADFGIGNVSLPLTIAAGSSATFPVIIDASGNGRRTATISIQSNDPDASPYTFDVTAVGVSPEINVTGLGQNIADGDLTPSGVDDTDFGIIDVASGSVSHTFTIQNVTGATGNLQLNAGAISVTGTHASDFTVSAITLPATISAGQSTTFVVTFNPSAVGLRTATVRILNNDLGEGTYDFAVQGYGGTPFITSWKTDNAGTSNSTSITIPTTGTGYNYDVDWNNDGTFDEFGLTGSVTHNYGTAGTYSVAIRGDFPRIYFNSGGDNRKLVSIDQWGSIPWTSMNSAFRGCANMVLNATDVPNLGAVTDMSSMFYGCSSFNQALPEGFNTSAATNMSYMFAFCSSYNQALPSTFNTSMVVDMSGMFRSCSAYNQPLPNSFNTQRVTDMSEMFYGCTSYNKALPNVFNTSLVTNMKSMFYDCSSYNEPLPSSFNTERVTNMELMFQGCSIYNHALPSSFTTSLVTDMSLMFYDCRAFNQNLGSLNLGAVTNMTGMLTNSGLSVTNYDATLTGWNDGGYTNKDLGDASPLKYCAAQAARTNLITNKGWTITGDKACPTITTGGTLLAFAACEGAASVAQSFTVSGSDLTADITITAPAGFEVSTTSGSAFGPSVTLAQNSGTVASTTVYVRLSATATGTPSDNVRLTSTNATDKTVAVSGTVNAKPTITLGTISAVNTTSTSFSIPYTSTTGSPDQFSLVTGTPVAMPNFSAVSNQSLPASPISVTIPASGAATYNFNLSVRKSSTGCVSAVVPVSLTVEAPAGRPFITRWDLSKTGSSSTGLSIGVQTTSGQQVSYTWTTVPASASGSGTFTGSSLNIGSLPANAIIDVSIYPTNFERININNGTDCQRLTEIKQWGEVAWTSMRLAFSGCSNMTLTAPDVPNLAGVMNMSFMFANCSSFNQALPEGFNTANVTDMWGMFSGCSAYNQALPSTFNTANVTRMVQMFNGCSSYNQALPISFNTANVTDMYGMFSNCSSYNQMLPSSFNTANVAYMNFMFRGCSSYNQAFPNSFNTANVTDMLSMFSGCSSFNQSLASFTLNANVNLVNSLDNSGLSVANYDATLTAFNAQNVTGRSMGAVGLNYCAAKSARDNLTNNKGWTITGDNYTLACLPADYTITTTGGNVIITDVTGTGETLEVSENSGKIRFNVTGKTYSIDGGITTAFTTPAEVVLSGKNSITVNTAGGNDIINVGAFTTQLPSLTINGGTGDDQVNMNGDITFVANANLDLDLQNDDVNAGMDEVTMGDNVTVSLSGTGTATVKASKGIVANAGVNLSASSIISLITNSIDIKNTAVISTNSASSVILRPYTNGVNIDLGAATNSLGGPLSLSDDELDRITAGTLQIGDANSGAITISAPISRAAATNVNLTTAGAVNLNASALATNGGNLAINAAGGINPTVAGTDVNVGTVSFASGNDLAIAINGPTADTDYHQLNVAGAVNLSGLDLVLSGSHVPVLGQTFVLVNNDGSDAIQGTFNGLPEGSTIAPFLGGQLNARISYVGGDGNDAVLTVIASVELPANTANVTICKNATASLTASCKVGQVTWYNAAGTTQLFVGSPLVTPTLTASTSYKVRCELAPQLSGFVDVMVTVVVPPTITLTTLQQTLNEGNNPVLCDTDANPVNGLQFNVTGLCVVGNPVWRVQVGSGAWSNWSATAPVSQPSNNQLHRYQAACDANCASTYSGVIALTINNRASVPQNVSLLVDGVTVAVGETKEVCSLVTTTLTFNANCAAGEVILYSVDGGEYSTGVPVGLVDNQYHNYRVRCRKSDGKPSCVESESGVMRLKLVVIPAAPTVSLSSTSSCNLSASFSGQSTCGSLRTVWYNATTNVALPSLPSTVPSQTTSYYARCQTENGCVSEKSNVVTFTLTPTQVAPVITASQEIVCTGTTVTISANCPAGSQTFWNTGVTAPSFEVAFSNVTKQTYWAKCLFEGGCQSSESVRKDIYWNAFVVTLINIGESKSAVKPANDKSLWTSQFITRDGGPELEQSTQVNPTLFYVENANKMAPRYWTINVEACGLSTDGSLTFDMLATPEMGVIRSFNTHENNAPYFMYANREGWTELYAQNHPAYGFYQDNGAGGNVYDAGLPKGLYKLGIRYWDQKGWGSIYPATRQPQGNVLAYQEYWFRIQSKDGVGVGAARSAESEEANGKGQGSDNGKQLTDNGAFATVLPNPVTSILRLKVQDSKGQVVQTVLTDVSGRSVLRRQFVPETNTHQEEFGVSELPAGVYFMQVRFENKQETLRVVKVH